MCNLHLQSFVRRADEIATLGVREVVIFHSAANELLQYESDLPFAVIADRDRQLYREFGVETAWRALLDPRAWLPVVRAVLDSARQVVREGRPVPPVRPGGGSFGLPADFLIAADGHVLAYKYGRHADDQWSVDELLSHVRSIGQSRDAATTHVSAA